MFSELTTVLTNNLPVQVTQLNKANFMLANNKPNGPYHVGVSASFPVQKLTLRNVSR